MTATATPSDQQARPTTSHRYLHVNPRYYPYIGGSEYYMQQIAERLAEAEPTSEVAVYTTDAWDLEHFWRAGQRTVAEPHTRLNGVEVSRFAVRRLPVVSPLFYPGMRRVLSILSDGPFPSRLSLPLLNELCRTTPFVPSLERSLAKPDGSRFDLVHAANAPLDSLIRAAFEYSRRRDAAFVLTPFVHLGEPTNTVVRRFYTMRHQLEWMKRADAVLTMTTLERDYLLERGVPGQRMHVVGVGIEPTEIEGGDGPAFRRRHAIEGPIVFFQGTAAFDKGAQHTVMAMQRLWRQGQTGTLVIAGPVMTHFQKFYDELPAHDRASIRFLGFISPQEKRDLFAAGDLFVMPSRTDSFGIVYLEAWLCGKPVIGANAGGVPAVISHGTDGVLVNFGAVEDLADAIRQLLNDPSLRTRLGQAGRHKVLQHYTWPVVFGQIHEIYRQVLS